MAGLSCRRARGLGALLAGATALAACRGAPLPDGDGTTSATSSGTAAATTGSDPASGSDGGVPVVPRPSGREALLPDAAPESLGLDPTALAAIDGAVAEAMKHHEIPGAVVLVARHGKVAFRRAYGALALAPEEEPMRPDALFDLASLTKPFATALAVMALVDDRALALGDRVDKHLGELAGTPAGRVTVEQLLLHAAGYPVGISPDALERGSARPLEVVAARARAKPDDYAQPGSVFRYGDLGYVVLGLLVERLAHAPLERYVAERVYARLGVGDVGFRRFATPGALDCPSPSLRDLPRLVPTERRGAAFLRGEVHDPIAHALGGVAGNAGLFASADAVAALAQAVLDGGAIGGDVPRSGRILSPASAGEMLRPRKIAGATRALGWDVDSEYSGNRGDVFPVGGFGHSGFTGTSVWVDRASDTLVVVLASRLHPDGKGDAKPLRRKVATQVARALRAEKGGAGPSPSAGAVAPAPTVGAATGAPGPVAVGIDVLEAEGFARLRGERVGLVTHAAAVDASGRSTRAVLARAKELTLVRLFAPEHGLDGAHQGSVGDETDPETGLPVFSLYGAGSASTSVAPSHLADLDAVVVDLADVGARFYTYVATLTAVLEAAAVARLPVVVLDRPNPGGGLDTDVEGPLPDAGPASILAPLAIPVRHGLTLGELARFACAERKLSCQLDVVPVRGWQRHMRFADTGLAWRAPSPNLRTPDAALLYPGVALLEYANVSVGRGTERPFEVVGAPWIDGEALALELSSVAGLSVAATSFTPVLPPGADPRTVPFAGQRCRGVRFKLIDGSAFSPLRLGLELASALVHIHGAGFEVGKLVPLLGDAEAVRQLARLASPAEVWAVWEPTRAGFVTRRAPYLLYPP